MGHHFICFDDDQSDLVEQDIIAYVRSLTGNGEEHFFYFNGKDETEISQKCTFFIDSLLNRSDDSIDIDFSAISVIDLKNKVDQDCRGHSAIKITQKEK